MKTVSLELGGRPFSLESGRMARQAGGAVLVRYGDSMVLVTATSDKKAGADRGFLPLAVHYVEKMYAAGRIPGNFFRREGRLSDPETLISRFIDRPIRPLFPEGYFFETQIIATVLSTDHVNEPAVAAMIGASAALTVSDIPFQGPIAGLRLGRVDGQYIINPTPEQREAGELDFFVCGSRDAILMVEGEAKEVSEAVALDGIMLAHKEMQPLIDLQEALQKAEGKAKRVVAAPEIDKKLLAAVEKACKTKLGKALKVKEKQARYAALDEVKDEVLASFYDADKDDESVKKHVKAAYDNLKKSVMREAILKSGERVDGRKTTDIRPITCELGVLPRAHGSALFTRGETQALVTATLGSREDEQMIDALSGISFKGFTFHYNFPPFSVGETTFLRGPGRREIGHGFLAEKAVSALLPRKEDFPYSLRIVSEILESNGSSSMASVCGASLAMMDAGVPLRKHVAGIAMGLIQEKSKTAVLSDILGDEDHLGDMDFKVAGTEDGITALQMDIKISGINKKVLQAALKQAHDGRVHILAIMHKAIKQAREGLSVFAPKFVAYKIAESRIRDLIGPGGKVIKGITEKTGAKVDVFDDGVVTVSSRDHKAVDQALDIIKSLTKEIAIGEIYHGPVKKVMEFGAFVELTPGTDGLVHISQLAEHNVERVEDVVHEGDMVDVKVIGFDKRGKLKLSMINVNG
ncbi:MAG: polyribonucleotide nucleotidyltransferase [Candidatus Lambdaproteobacteria bacterium]|nr:polyribonucleotide nucleotidyltransferase [Candidatus Lambdaproteobacteria bacterium]